MKKLILIFAGAAVANIGLAQTWNTTGNSASGTDFLGTRNGMPLLFYTNNTLQMTLQKTGQLTLNNLAGSGNRLVLADGSGNLKPLASGSSSQVLLGTGDWGNMPTPQWMQSGSSLYYNSGFVGIGNTNPQSALDVTGQVNVSDQLSVGNNLLVGPSTGKMTFNYSPGDAATPAILRLLPSGVIYHGGVIIGNTSPDPQPNLTCLNGNVSVVTAFANVISVATNTTSTLATGGNVLLGHTGTKAFIETQGSGTGGGNHPGDLFINENCGRNVHVFLANTGTPFANNSTNVMSVEGSFNVSRIMQLGEYSANNFTHTNSQLYINANTSQFGIKVRHFQPGAGIKVVELDSSVNAFSTSYGYNAGNNDGPDRFTVQGNGKTTITSTSPYPLVVMNQTTGVPVLQVNHNGNESKMWVMNSTFSYNMGIDAAGIGHIGANINAASQANLINFKTDPSNNAQVWIGNMKQAAGAHTDFRLAVDGKLVARSCYITVSNWADYVFASDYKLPSLYETEAYYKANKHLPEIPSESEVKENGIDVGEMNKLLLKKIEEMTIQMVQQQKDIDALKAKIK